MKTLFIVFIGLALTISTYSQIDDYSLFNHTDLYVNPALTGLMESKWRVREVFRRYTGLGDEIYMNNYISAEMRMKFHSTFNNYINHVDQELNSSYGIGIYDERQIYRKQYIDQFKRSYSSDFISLALHKAFTKRFNFSVGVQPGFVQTLTNKGFDANIGVLFGFGEQFCWKEDMLFRTQIGFSAYHVLHDLISKKDTSIIKLQSRLQAHGGTLININKKVGIYPNFHLIYSDKMFENIGFTLVYLEHQTFWDRLRAGINYRSSEHLALSTGIRLFNDKQKGLVYEIALSYDVNLGKFNLDPYYQNAFDISLTIYPFEKCWSLNKCITE